MRPGSVVVVRDGRLIQQPNLALRRFRTEAATAVRRANLTVDEDGVVWALILAADGWDTVPEWVRIRLRRRARG